MKKYKKGRRRLLWTFVGLATLYVVIAYFVKFSPPCVDFLLNGFGGNLTGEILGGILFLVLAIYLEAETDDKIDEIVNVTNKSENLLSEREKILEYERVVLRFEQFMRNETYHNVRFPELKQNSPAKSLGLEYKIVPVRDSKTGEPRKLEKEMGTYFVIQVVGPAEYDYLTPEDQKDYEDSPIQESEYYFCQFYNGYWHMSTETVSCHWYKFYLSSKVGPVQWGQSANELMATFEDPIATKQLVAHLLLKEDGTEITGSGGGYVL